MEQQSLIGLAIKKGADNAAVIGVNDIPFKREFRAACEQNTCGKYGTCWMCPPDVGDIDDLIAKAKGYKHAFIFQSIGKLEDSFDIEGMQDAAHRHNRLALELGRELEQVLGDPLRLAAGSCQVCESCSRRDDTPCRFPEKAIASLEAYGIAVSELAKACGLNYINGQNTVTYFGGFLFNGDVE